MTNTERRRPSGQCGRDDVRPRPVSAPDLQGHRSPTNSAALALMDMVRREVGDAPAASLTCPSTTDQNSSDRKCTRLWPDLL